jgi:hypothetical protein
MNTRVGADETIAAGVDGQAAPFGAHVRVHDRYEHRPRGTRDTPRRGLLPRRRAGRSGDIDDARVGRREHRSFTAPRSGPTVRQQRHDRLATSILRECPVMIYLDQRHH